MGSIYQNANVWKPTAISRRSKAGFIQWNLTTENIELVLEDCVVPQECGGQAKTWKRCTGPAWVIRGPGAAQV